jgi:hypothetical protein
MRGPSDDRALARKGCHRRHGGTSEPLKGVQRLKLIQLNHDAEKPGADSGEL